MSLGKKESPNLTYRKIFSDKYIEIDIMMAISAKTIINKIAQGDVNIFSELTFFKFLTFFAPLTGNDASNRLNIIIFAISRSISVEIDTSLALFQKK